MQIRKLFGLLHKHQENFVQEQKSQQLARWKENVLDVYAGDASSLVDLYGCSTLLHRASDPTFIVVSIKNRSRGIQKYDPQKHSVLEVIERRVFAKDKLKREAYQASLAAAGQDPKSVTHDVCKVMEGDAVVEVYVHAWENKGKGRFENVWIAKSQQSSCVVPAYLIRVALPSSVKVKVKVAEGEGVKEKVKEIPTHAARKVKRAVMQGLVMECKVFHMSFGIFCANRPHDVRFGKREACACVYHLRGEYLFLALKQHADYLFDESLISEGEHTQLMVHLGDATSFLNAIVCPREEGRSTPSLHVCAVSSSHRHKNRRCWILTS